jgi:hypothetical protein
MPSGRLDDELPLLRILRFSGDIQDVKLKSNAAYSQRIPTGRGSEWKGESGFDSRIDIIIAADKLAPLY